MENLAPVYIIILLALPLVSQPAFLFSREKKLMDSISIVTSALMQVLGLMLAYIVKCSGSAAVTAPGNIFYLDAVSVVILNIVLIISFLAALYSAGYLAVELRHGKIQLNNIRNYYMLMYIFIFAMVLALSVRNMGIMWIAVEATTLASAFLVGFYNDKRSVEAAWKYVIICSVGIAVALLGIIFLHLSYSGVKGLEYIQLDWAALYNNAEALKSPALKLAFIFILVGFGTKAGLAPMHTWLPDAHSQAPSPISALLSGVLLNSAVYVIIRTTSVINKNLESSEFSGNLLIAFGLLSIAAAAIFIITQKDYKRLLAYSSIEHIGLITVSIGIFTPLSIFAAFLHMLNHSFTKSLLFLSSGNVYLKYGTRDISRIKGVLRALPVSGTAMLLGLFAIGGTPPFSIFTSEFNIVISAVKSGRIWVAAIILLFVTLVFAGIAIAIFKMFYPFEKGTDMTPGEQNIAGTAAVIALFIVISTTGFYIPDCVRQLLSDAQRIITGG